MTVDTVRNLAGLVCLSHWALKHAECDCPSTQSVEMPAGQSTLQPARREVLTATCRFMNGK